MAISEKDKSSRMAFADGLRAIAATWVVLYHLAEGHHIDQLLEKFPDLLRVVLFDSGGLGVAIFFVLSGYVMAYTMRSSHAHLRVAGNFLLRRLVRLSPPYYFALVFSVALLYVKAKVSGTGVVLPDAQTIIEHLFYLEDFLNSPVINSVFWTLSVEVQFYIAFALMLLLADGLGRVYQWRDARLYVTVFAGLLALPWAFQWIVTPLWRGGFIGFWYSFVLGVMVCLATRQAHRWFKQFAYAYIALIGLSAFATQQTFSIAATLTAILLMYADTKNLMGKWLNWRWIQTIGLISYSLYLLHNPVTGATANVIRRVLPASLGTDIVVFVVSISACLVAAWLAYKIIELPSIRLSRKVSRSEN